MNALGTKTITFCCTLCVKKEAVTHTPRVGLYMEPGVPQGWVEQSFMVRTAAGGLFRSVSFPFCSRACQEELLKTPEADMPGIVQQELEWLSMPGVYDDDEDTH